MERLKVIQVHDEACSSNHGRVLPENTMWIDACNSTMQNKIRHKNCIAKMWNLSLVVMSSYTDME